jgi:transcriptional regulator with PAS, ATPase and Fis domain
MGASERRIDEDTALRAVVEGTASETGLAFYRALVRNLAAALDTYGAWLTEAVDDGARLRALAFWMGDRFIEPFEYPVAGTPCETTVREGRLLHIPDQVLELYPDDHFEFPRRPVSYLGMPLYGSGERLIGHLAVVDVRPMSDEKRLLTLFRLFANRAAAEMRRLRLEEDLRDRQEQLERLVGSAMDAIVEMDGALRVTRLNAAAGKVFACAGDRARGQPVDGLVGPAAARQLGALAVALEQRAGPDQSLWIPGGLQAEPAGRPPFPAEATLSRFEVCARPYYTLILRNVDERVEAERTIRSLTATAAYLSERLAEEHGFGHLVGRSPAMRRALKAVTQVAGTAASVLILGETGTGKELFAHAIHERSPRRDRPLVKVNCAAIPATLIESEFFGHERGAFTGATARREGRFALADGGTIFLDEIGDLPLELQGKLLRVLQEGEFEPVGSGRTRRVDVRVIAATNRELEAAVQGGSFRADLYYRLGVFPLRLPPLRERGDDVLGLAEALAGTLARSLGRAAPALEPADLSALRAYAWPGNVRELRNVLERALITSPDGRLHLDRALPAAGAAAASFAGAGAEGQPRREGEVLSEQALRRLERDNMLAALARAGWRVGGEGGAAALLGVSPSTLKSRMKALGLRAPAGGARSGGSGGPAARTWP